MKIFAADDEVLQLEKLRESIEEAQPDAELACFLSVYELLDYAKDHGADVAFLDIHMRGMTGLELAKRLKEENARLNIVFVTSYDQYKGEAMDMRASGYVMKPVTAKKIMKEIEDLRYPVLRSEGKKELPVRVQCFGNFDIFDREGNTIAFGRSKARELLAYLIMKNGSRCTTRELMAVLFEDAEYDKKLRDRFQHVVSSMMKGLKEAGAEAIVVRSFQNYSINKNLVDCDYYRFLDMDMEAVNRYQGEFMSQYEWAEFLIPHLENSKK